MGLDIVIVNFTYTLSTSLATHTIIMDRYKETFDTWNKVASLYQEKFMDMSFYDETYDFICSTVVKISKLTDRFNDCSVRLHEKLAPHLIFSFY